MTDIRKAAADTAHEVWSAAHGVHLAGRRVLVVEDEVLIATIIGCELEEAGAEVVGPAHSVDEALAIAGGEATIDVAVLDINLYGRKVWPVAEALSRRGVPYVFASANAIGADAVPEPFAAAPRFDKPLAMPALLRTIADLTA